MINRNVFIYWSGKEYSLINILRNLIFLHSKNGKGYNIHFINDDNLNKYVKEFPENFDSLHLAHKADYIRVYVICEYGGIWLDSDTLVLDSLDSLFDIFEKKDGFFITQNNQTLWNGIFGSKEKTDLIKEWKKRIIKRLSDTKQLSWCEIGNNMLEDIKKDYNSYYDNYHIFNGLENMYSVNWDKSVNEFLNKNYDNYQNIIRDYQPLIVLVNSVYKKLENLTEKEILSLNKPLNYFINLSFSKLNLLNYDFVEIGTSNFDTLIEKADDNTLGISVDIIKNYLDKLPNKKNVKKYNIGISDKKGEVTAYYIPENVIVEKKLPNWFKGCNSINNYHPLHLKHKVTDLCVKEKVNIIPINELFYKNSVRGLKYLKIDTEGHDTVIMKSLYNYIKSLPIDFYPKKILFKSNEHSNKEDVEIIINLFTGLGYKLEKRGYDTIIVFDKSDKVSTTIIDLPKKIAICLIGGDKQVSQNQISDIKGIEDSFEVEWYLRSDIYTGEYWTYSQIINEAIISTESEFMVFINPKTKTNKNDIIEIINDLCSGYCWSGLIAFGLWGSTKELFRHIGLMDERFIYSEYEDNDFSLRLKVLGKAVKWDARFEQYKDNKSRNRNKRLSYNIFNKKWPVLEKNNDYFKYAYLNLEEKKLPKKILENKKDYIYHSWNNFDKSFINTDSWVANLLSKSNIVYKRYNFNKKYTKSILDIKYDGIKLTIKFLCNENTSIQVTANSLEETGYLPMFGSYLIDMKNNTHFEKNIKIANSLFELVIMHENEIIYYNKLVIPGFKQELNIGLQVKQIIYDEK